MLPLPSQNHHGLPATITRKRKREHYKEREKALHESDLMMRDAFREHNARKRPDRSIHGGRHQRVNLGSTDRSASHRSMLLGTVKRNGKTGRLNSRSFSTYPARLIRVGPSDEKMPPHV